MDRAIPVAIPVANRSLDTRQVCHQNRGDSGGACRAVKCLGTENSLYNRFGRVAGLTRFSNNPHTELIEENGP